MEKPSYAFNNITYFNLISSNNNNYYIFSDFETNWDLFQFLTNNNKYYFVLKKHYNSKYNFDILYNTYLQKLKHINIENLHFIICLEEQQLQLKQFPILFNYSFTDTFINMLKIDKIFIEHFDTYNFDEAIISFNKNEFINCDKLMESIEKDIEKTIVKRSIYDTVLFKNIVFFWDICNRTKIFIC